MECMENGVELLELIINKNKLRQEEKDPTKKNDPLFPEK
jgi:hypothetical protein